MPLVFITVVAFSLSGACLAYLSWTRANGKKSAVSKVVWLANMVILFSWAYLAGILMSRPQATDAIAVLAVALGLVGCWGSYRLAHRHLLQK